MRCTQGAVLILRCCYLPLQPWPCNTSGYRGMAHIQPAAHGCRCAPMPRKHSNQSRVSRLTDSSDSMQGLPTVLPPAKVTPNTEKKLPASEPHTKLARNIGHKQQGRASCTPIQHSGITAYPHYPHTSSADACLRGVLAATRPAHQCPATPHRRRRLRDGDASK